MYMIPPTCANWASSTWVWVGLTGTSPLDERVEQGAAPSGPSALVGLPPWPMMAGLSVADALDGAVQCGVDLVEVGRIREVVQKYGERFLHRVWTERELAICRGRFP